MTAMTIRPLPRSLDPLPLESLPGYLLRLAHRLDLAPARIAVLTGLSPPGPQLIRASHMFALDADTTERFACATRLTSSEVTALTLTRFSGRYPPLDLRFCGRQRTIPGILVKETWAYFRGTRYCPDCLAGDGSTIQQRDGGPWDLRWRLPITFACLTHRRLLEHTCPACGQPAHDRTPTGRGSSPQMLPLAARSGLHSAQCRNPMPAPGTRARIRPCGTRLDTAPATVRHEPAAALLDLQQRLLAHLAGGPATTRDLDRLNTPQRYIVDLRILCCLITASWPAAGDLVDPPARALLDDHVHRLRRQIAAIRQSGTTVRELALSDAPPMDAATCANLLATADGLLTGNGIDNLRDVLHPLVAGAPPGMGLWLRQFLHGNGYCSSDLQTVLGIDLGNREVRTRLGLPPDPPSPPSPPPRERLHFGVQHIPQHLLPEWHAEHLVRLAGKVKPRLLRRAAAVRLAQICVGGPPATAARHLGIPRDAAHNALTVVQQQQPGRRQRQFDAAVDAIADQLNTTNHLTDYGRRRDTLAHWSLPADDWTAIASNLRNLSGSRRTGRWPNTPYIDWGNSKRLLASMWIWVHITHGEHLFAPAVRPNLDQRRPGGNTIREIHSRWPLINTDHPKGHYNQLREHLETYADQLIIDIETSPTIGSRPDNWRARFRVR
jgi:hypothetical protein